MFERYSDSAGNYVVLDPHNQAVYKQLYRAAKAKTKLRIKVIISDATEVAAPQSSEVTSISEVTLAPTLLPLHPASDAPKELPTATFAKSAEPRPKSEKKATLEAPPKYEVQPTQPKLEEAPLPRAFALRDQLYEDLADAAKLRTTALRAKDQTLQVPLTSFTVQCNHCSTNIPGPHWHCTICDSSDFDLCLACIESGFHCDVDSHYLIKRTIENGRVKYSTSTIVDKKTSKPDPKVEEVKKEKSGHLEDDTLETHAKEAAPREPLLTRTCNCCVNGESLLNAVHMPRWLNILQNTRNSCLSLV